MKPSVMFTRRSALAAAAALPWFSSPCFAIDSREAAPKFRAKSMDGEAFNNDSLLGKNVLLQFWATWCPYCKRDQEALDIIHREFSGKLLVLNVDVGESRKTVKRFLEDFPKSGKVVLTEDTNLAAVFAAKAYPHYVLIDDRGKIAGEQKGAGGERALRYLLSKAGLKSSEESDFNGELESSPIAR
jgi:thiol-disulfide isomerase/thioredoxin